MINFAQAIVLAALNNTPNYVNNLPPVIDGPAPVFTDLCYYAGVEYSVGATRDGQVCTSHTSGSPEWVMLPRAAHK